MAGVNKCRFFCTSCRIFTRGEEFHSEKHRITFGFQPLMERASCADLPLPSVPSTTKSLPGYWCLP